jgi:quercetin dioxygenase-like cupin family protein
LSQRCVIRRFESPDESRTFPKGRFELVQLGGLTIGRARYEPGWRWSEHVGPEVGRKTCDVEHVGLVVSGHAKVLMEDGEEVDLRTGDLFFVPPGHDSWVVGSEPYVSLHLMGAERYGKSTAG